jgi:phosphosulfolactate phosphohydrolase-like enzyme
MPRDTSHLVPFKKGQSGNPGGRRSKPLIVEALQAIGEANDSEKAKKVAASLYASALKGSVPAAKLIVEYLHGKPKRAEEDKKEASALTKEQIDQQLTELLKDKSTRDRLAKLISPEDVIQ